MLNQGATLGTYTIERELGRGAQAVVYLAHDRRSQRAVAIKVTNCIASDDALDRLRNELQLARSLDHPSICAPHDIGVAGANAYVVMDYVPGESLALRIQRRRATGLSQDEPLDVLRTFVEVARAVDHAHDAGVLHRDLKPGNILMRTDGVPVIVDFGLGKLDGDVLGTTQSGLRGSPAYLAPELLLGSEATRSSDVWALAVSLYECIALQRPFDEPTREALYRSILADEAPVIRTADPALSDALAVVMTVALDKDPAHRYASAGALADDLARLLRGEPIHARRPGFVRRVRKSVVRNRALLTVSLALAVGVIVTAWMLSRVWTASRASVDALANERAVSKALAEERDRLSVLLDYDELQQLERERSRYVTPEPKQIAAMRGWRKRARSLASRCAARRGTTPRGDADRSLIEDLVRRGEKLLHDGRSLSELIELTAHAVVRDVECRPAPRAIAGAGDIDGDGISDYLLCSAGRRRNSESSVRVLSGRDDRVLWKTADDDATKRFVAVVGELDLDGDDVPDFAVGFLGVSGRRGGVRAYSGKQQRVLFELRGEHDGAELGSCLAPLPDLDGDGRDDLAIGAPRWQQRGCVLVVSGASGRTLGRHRGEAPGDRFGHAVAGLPDLDGDGNPELLVGAHRNDSAGVDAGAATVLCARRGSARFSLRGTSSRDLFGWSVAALGDVDRDGTADFAVGADWEEGERGTGNAGAVHVFSGATGGRLLHVRGDRPKGLFGYSICAAGDVDADGHADLLVGAPATVFGHARLVSGRDGSSLLELADPRYVQLGFVVARIGDLDGDDLPELAVCSASVIKAFASESGDRPSRCRLLRLAAYFRRKRGS